jgi:hypothetical protein
VIFLDYFLYTCFMNYQLFHWLSWASHKSWSGSVKSCILARFCLSFGSQLHKISTKFTESTTGYRQSSTDLIWASCANQGSYWSRD